MRVYIMDFDDTIIKNHEVDFHSFEQILSKHRIKFSKAKLLCMRQRGMNAKNIFEKLAINVEGLVRERQLLLKNKSIWDYAKLNCGARQALRAIKTKGDEVVIVTKKKKYLVKYILQRLNLSKYITEVYTSKNKNSIIEKIIKQNKDSDFIFVNDDPKELAVIKYSGSKYSFHNSYRCKSDENYTTLYDLRGILR